MRKYSWEPILRKYLHNEFGISNNHVRTDEKF